MDLRNFLKELEAHSELERFGRPVSLQYQLGDILFTLEQKGLGAGLFLEVGKSMPVVGGILASPRRIALALGCRREEIVDRCLAALTQPCPPKRVEKAACQEVVFRDEEVDLGFLPVPVHARRDRGPFITAGVVVSKDPETGCQNLSFQRMQVKGKNKLGIMINEWRHLRDFYRKAELQGESLPISVAIGVNPCIMMAAGFRYDGDEMELAGALAGEELPVSKSVTNDILVPADAEIIIEGVIEPHAREEEGPLGEFTGHYSKAWPSPVLRVKAMSMRKNPIYQTIAGASFEHVNLGNVLPREPILKQFVTYASGNVKALHLPPYGSGFLALIALEKTNPGEPKNVALAALVSHVNIKAVIVVDPDIDIFNPHEVLWALTTRVRPDLDVFTVPGAQGHELDPTSDDRGVLCKVGIDATQLEKNSGFERVRYRNVNLDDVR
ncbi:UbiD decarboxylyase family [Acididesulfobacillus acetoxydans]|uniref:3-octaprenyl-4-hydroxybenzoate carboxy-lyase n=1 Tax=Acididesulfobacillus acetoxydans TaxID=1561005 RepID=A0A8S0W7Q7_9FIRM|nr:UbiD family decarboxylase [Acididesulfobacillus acetoxydans]CAA7601029.1 UbiD decarboxylyase family [Acididesulfobacillus acetoxydans]CEJ06903.1 3-octaprenyl-4-hydroxybenzoate carboxy-lyase [Acididesulfobacillus acetoxydans]